MRCIITSPSDNYVISPQILGDAGRRLVVALSRGLQVNIAGFRVVIVLGIMAQKQHTYIVLSEGLLCLLASLVPTYRYRGA